MRGIRALVGTVLHLGFQPRYKNVVGGVLSFEEATALIESDQPDILVMDVAVPGKEFKEAAQILFAVSNPPRLVILSASFNAKEWLELLSLGMCDYLLHSEDVTLIVDIVRVAAKGMLCLSPAVFEQLTTEASSVPTSPSPSPSMPNVELSEREIQVLRLAAKGKTNEQIARLLNLSPRTVRYHLTNIYNKTGSNSKAQAVAWAVQHGLVTLDED